MQIAPLPNEGTNTCEGQKKIDPWKPLPVFCIPSGIPQEDPVVLVGFSGSAGFGIRIPS